MTSPLPRAPATFVDPGGDPRWGAYTGPLPPVLLGPFARRQGRLAGLLRRKRWLYIAIATERHWIGLAITDLTYATNAFFFAVELGPPGRMLLERSAIGAPRLGGHVGDLAEEGCDAWFRSPSLQLSVRRPSGSTAYEVSASSPGLHLRASVETASAPEPHCAILRPPGSPLMATEKRALMGTRGFLELPSGRIDLDGARAGMDYSHGYPPRETRWRWAFLLGQDRRGVPLAMNLVQGFNGQPECVVWHGNKAFPIDEGCFQFDAMRPEAPWQITSNELDLRFSPSASHAETHDLGLIASRFLQPAGRFQGTISLPGVEPIELEGASGVVEDQFVRWLPSGSARAGRRWRRARR